MSEDWSCAADFLDDIEVDEAGKCRWTDIANAQRNIRMALRSVQSQETERLRERVAEMQAEAGMYHSLYDVATERLASARKALEEINNKIPHNIRCKCEACCICNIATAALLSLTDEKG